MNFFPVKNSRNCTFLPDAKRPERCSWQIKTLAASWWYLSILKYDRKMKSLATSQDYADFKSEKLTNFLNLYKLWYNKNIVYLNRKLLFAVVKKFQLWNISRLKWKHGKKLSKIWLLSTLLMLVETIKSIWRFYKKTESSSENILHSRFFQ